MYKKTIALFLLLLLLVEGQSQNRLLAPLKVGDSLPQFLSAVAVDNPDGSKKHLADYEGKLLILDFWDVTCMACIEAMPEMDSLQQAFGASIQIVMVTRNPPAQVAQLFSKIKIQRPALPMILNDTVLQQAFPHVTVPHHVWIDQQGRVQFITYSYNTNAQNISAFLHQEPLRMSLKKEGNHWDESEPLWTEGSGQLSPHLQYYSFIMNHLDEYGGSSMQITEDTVLQKVGVRLVNQPIVAMYKVAFGSFPQGEFDVDNRILLEVKDPGKLNWPPINTDEWLSENLYCYELSLPVSRKNELHRVMLQDIKSFFGYEAKVTRRNVKSLALVRTSATAMLHSTGGTPFKTYKDGVLYIHNLPVSSLVESLVRANEHLPLPIVDGTGYSGKVDLILKAKLTDRSALRKALSQYGLDLVEKKMNVRMLVIHEQQK